MANATSASPAFLRVPYEIRLAIYEYLLFPSEKPSPHAAASARNLRPAYSIDPQGASSDPFTLHVRIIDPCLGVQAKKKQRSKVYVKTGHSTLPTTYRIPLTPHTPHLSGTIPALLALNKQIHAEAAALLYSTYTFAFSTNIEAIVPFLSDLTPVARASVRSVQLTKKLAMGEFDRAEWGHACGFLGRRLRLRRLGVGVVVAGKWGESDEEDVLDEDGNSEGEQGLEPQQLQTPPPSPTSSDVTSSLTTGSWLSTIKPISRQEFEFMRRMQREWDVKVEGVDLEWVEQLMQIRGLEDLKVGVIRESGCGRGMVRNDGMRFWVAFGRSVEGGFREWVSGVMVG